jgi:large conductance mechanosensitive channel
MPPIGLLLGKVDFASLFIVLDSSKGVPASLADAKAKGIPVIAYGAFFNDLVNFVIMAFVIFLLVKFVNRLRRKDSSTKDCPQCLTAIPVAAIRCAACCVDLKAAA